VGVDSQNAPFADASTLIFIKIDWQNLIIEISNPGLYYHIHPGTDYKFDFSISGKTAKLCHNGK
jgi:hypothetical protein